MKKVTITMRPVYITYSDGVLNATGTIGEMCLDFSLKIDLRIALKTLGYPELILNLNEKSISICEEDIPERELWRLFEIRFEQMELYRVEEAADPEIVMN